LTTAISIASKARICGYESETSIHVSQEKNYYTIRPIAAGKNYRF